MNELLIITINRDKTHLLSIHLPLTITHKNTHHTQSFQMFSKLMSNENKNTDIKLRKPDFFYLNGQIKTVAMRKTIS